MKRRTSDARRPTRNSVTQVQDFWQKTMSQATPSARRKARRFTMQALYQWQLAGAAVSDIEAQFLANQDFAKVDREYFHDLLHGVPAQVKELDELLTPFLDRRVEELSQIEKAILRLGAYYNKTQQT